MVDAWVMLDRVFILFKFCVMSSEMPLFRKFPEIRQFDCVSGNLSPFFVSWLGHILLKI